MIDPTMVTGSRPMKGVPDERTCSVAVSGLPQLEDHRLVVEVLEAILATGL
ncbi:hypothetical protein [Nocardioides guangzhouensis]|uniref:hypothetical protein n=1 Tax=Nocardioides guangzhouensis TaxID=2497878 RepID=UPI00143840B9|nr:hypothetical protein [Nocardioides guangzhouensis]